MSLERGIELIIGPMFCGKTDELLRRLRIMEIPNRQVQLFKPKIDDRYSENNVCSHSKSKRSAIVVKNTAHLIEKYDEKADVIGIDELQFFDYEIVDFLLNNQEKHLFIVSGLPFNFRGEYFKFNDSEEDLISLIPYTTPTYLISRCNKCGDNAGFTQRLINDKPAPYSDPEVVVGGKKITGKKESYEARCFKHFWKPIKGEENKFLVKGKIKEL